MNRPDRQSALEAAGRLPLQDEQLRKQKPLGPPRGGDAGSIPVTPQEDAEAERIYRRALDHAERMAQAREMSVASDAYHLTRQALKKLDSVIEMPDRAQARRYLLAALALLESDK